MYKLNVLPEARNDLAKIKGYISQKLLPDFCRYEDRNIFVSRILYARLDYMRILFGGLTFTEMETESRD